MCLVAVMSASGEIPAADAVYRWVDEDGRVHFSDRPEGDDATAVTVETPAPIGDVDAERARRRRRLLEVYELERAERARAKAEATAEAETRAARCKAAQVRARRYREARYLYDKNDAGERVVFDADERAELEDAAAAAVKKWCGPPR